MPKLPIAFPRNLHGQLLGREDNAPPHRFSRQKPVQKRRPHFIGKRAARVLSRYEERFEGIQQQQDIVAGKIIEKAIADPLGFSFLRRKQNPPRLQPLQGYADKIATLLNILKIPPLEVLGSGCRFRSSLSIFSSNGT